MFRDGDSAVGNGLGFHWIAFENDRETLASSREIELLVG
jgi:hypothetical protein